MGIGITGKFEPTGSFPLIEDTSFLGGLQIVDTITDAGNIPALNRKEGMLVFIIDDNGIYKLESDLTTWTQLNFGASDSNVMTSQFLLMGG